MLDMLLDEIRPYAFLSDIKDIPFEEITPLIHRILPSVSNQDAEKLVIMLISIINNEKNEKIDF